MVIFAALAWTMLKEGMPMTADALTNDSTFQSLKLSMEAATLRHQAIASNIANVNTPNYKRVDLSPTFQAQFDQTMQKLAKGDQISMLPKGQLSESQDIDMTRFDGNNVNLDKEMVALMENQTKFSFAARMLAQKYQSISSAITGKF